MKNWSMVFCLALHVTDSDCGRIFIISLGNDKEYHFDMIGHLKWAAKLKEIYFVLRIILSSDQNLDPNESKSSYRHGHVR